MDDKKVFYRLKEGTRYRREEFGGLLFYPGRFLTLELNETSFQMMPLLQGGASLDEICQRFGWSEAEGPPVLRFLTEFVKSGVVEEVK